MTPQPAEEQAVEWFVRQDAGPLPPEQRHAFERWRSIPANAAAYERIGAMWRDFGAGAPPTANTRVSQRRHARRFGAAIAACVLVFVLGPQIRLWIMADHRTEVGQVRTVTLPDGSSITLNTNPAVALAFNSSERAVRLLEGEAAFDVAPDATRPFVVMSAGGTTRALGTLFDVRMLDSTVRVTGIEHRVEVSYEGAYTSVDAGEQVHYGSARGLSDVSLASPLSAAWRHGRLVVENWPLRDVVAELNRYKHGRIQLVGSGLGDMRVNGVFPLTDPATSVVALEHSLGIRAIGVTSYLVLLTR